MLVTVLLALLAVTLAATGGTANNVNASCQAGRFFGGIEITVTTIKSALAGARVAGVYFDNTDAGTGYSDAASGFDDSRCSGTGWNANMDYCDSCNLTADLKNSKILVVVYATGDDTTGYEVQQSKLDITVTNVNNLVIKKDTNIPGNMKVAKPEEGYGTINSVNIKYSQMFNTKESLTDICYCPATIGCNYPKGDCYNFKTFSMDGMLFLAGGIIHSDRAITDVNFNNITFFGATVMTINLFPGIYQGGSQGHNADMDGVKRLKFTNVTATPGKFDLTIEGNALDVQWDKLTSAAPITFVTTTRTSHPDIFCTVPGCTDTAFGKMNLHSIKNSNLFDGSSILVQGWVEKIETSQFVFTASGTAPDKWNIKSKYAPTGCSRDYNVGQADFFGGGTAGTPGTTIDSDIHFSICKANFNNVSMTNHIQSESDNVDVKDSIFNGYIRHVVGFSLAINSAIYNGDTYYDHFTEAKYNYPTAVLNTITLANKDFVVSVDNGTMDELLDLNTIICGHSGGAANWLEPKEGDRVFLVRHMSQRITMNTVTGCNLYFKNTINNKQTTRQIDLGLPQTFTYDSLVATNTMNNYAFFDDAAYHVTTNINIENNPSIGYIKFNRVDIDNQSEGGDIHPPEVDPLGRSGYGTSYPVNMVIKNNTLIHHFYVTNSDLKGMVDPTSNATGNCATGGHGNSLKRDITQNVRHKTHQNDDVNLTMENNEILTITIDADSLKADILKLLNLGNTSINLADSSSVRIRDSRFRDVLMECHEAFELTLRHTITDGITGFTGGKGSLYDFRSVNFYNMDRTTHEYGTQVPVTLEIQSGYMNLDHIKIEYGQLSIMNLLGDIKVVQSLGVLAPARFDIMSKFGTVNVTHPDKYYRNMNEVIDFEFKSGSILDFEYAKTDSFIFEVAPSMRVTASNFRNLEPTIISSYVQIASEYGSITWEYAKNLDISAVKSVSSADTLEFAGYDNIVAVSSISAAGHEGFFDFDIENLDFSKMYFVTIHDTNGASNDVVDGKVTTSNSGNKYECKRADTTKENDPFDACYGYLILPTVDLNAADFDLAKQPSLVIDSVNVFLKDCASSALNKLEIKGAGSVWASSIVASSLSVTLKYHMYSSYLWWRNTTYLGLFSITAKSVDVIGVADMGTDATVSLNSSAALKIYPTHVTVKSTGTTGVNYGARAAYPTLGVPTITGACTVVQEGPYSSCNNQIATPEGSTFDFDSKFADATPSNVNISLGSGVNGSILLVTHGTSKQLKDFVPAATAVIAANEHIVIDNHRFATSYATSFNYGYEGFDTPIPTTNNVYVIPTKNAFSAIVHFDTDADGMLYNTNSFTGSTVDTLKTHKFNLAEQAVLYLYVPAADGISITTAGDNINLYLGDIGTYSRIYTTSLVVANVLRAKTVDTVAAAVFSLQGSGAFNTNFGYVGINADKASAKILLESPENEAGNYAQTPNVILQKAKLADIGIYSRRYKTITDCDVHLSYGSNVNCKQVVVPCKEELCDIVNYIWEPTYKLFWVGKDFDKSTKNNDSMYVRFDTSLEQLLNACPNDGRDYGTIHCPNTPLYDEIIDFMSTVIIRGSPKISSSFEATANKNNRSVNPVNLGEVQVDAPGMPGWAIGLIVITCVIAAVVLVMFVLRLLGKESLSDFGSTTVGALGPTN